MRFPRTPFVLAMLVAGGPLFGQQPIRVPNQTREPPLADEVLPAKGGFDPDESSDVKQVQYVTPAAPATLPGEVRTTPTIVPAGYTEPAGELPTPTVTLNVEGSDVSPSGQTVSYKLVVRNGSRARAHNVVVKVVPPKNVTKVKADPPPTHDDAESKWELKTLEPGQSRTIELVYKPNANVDEVKIQARVQFDFGRGMITQIKPPTLSVTKDGPETMVVGDTQTYRITVTNTGRVIVRDIEVKDLLAKGLVYEEREISRGTVDGRLTASIDAKAGERTWTIPSLAPGQSEKLDFRVKAREAGHFPSTVLVKAPEVMKEASFNTEVLTAQLQLHAEGPPNGKGTVDQPSRYTMVVENRGSADLKNVVVRCQLPPDMRPKGATSGGERFRDSVQWIFKELKKGDVKELSITLTTSSPGMRTIHFSARAEKGSEQKDQVKTEFAGVPSLDWDIEAPGVAVAGKTITYRVTVANRGTAPGKAQLRVDLPPSLDLKDTKPPAGQGFGQNAKEVRFPEYTFPAGKKTTFAIMVDARSAGEAKSIFSLLEEGREAKKEDKITHVTAADTRGPTGPPPARGADPTNIGMGPRP